MTFKTCSRCNSEKSESDFYASYKSVCKCCVRLKSTNTYRSDIENQQAKRRNYYHNVVDKAKERERSAEKRCRLKDSIKDQHTKHLNANREFIYQRNQILSKTEKYKAKRIERDKRKTEVLADGVIKRLLIAGTKLRFKEIPTYLIDMKREQLLLARAEKQLTEIIKEKSNGN